MSKKLFPVKPEVDFQRQHFSVITSIKPEHMPFEFRKSVHQFSGYGQKAFSRRNRMSVFSDNIFLSSLLSNLIIYRLNFEILSNRSQVMGQKPVSEGRFRISWPNRKQISKSKSGVPYSALNSNYWRLNFENPSIGCRVMWPQHSDIQTYIHTYRHTDIQTYIHTDRQTDGTKI